MASSHSAANTSYVAAMVLCVAFLATFLAQLLSGALASTRCWMRSFRLATFSSWVSGWREYSFRVHSPAMHQSGPAPLRIPRTNFLSEIQHGRGVLWDSFVGPRPKMELTNLAGSPVLQQKNRRHQLRGIVHHALFVILETLLGNMRTHTE